MADDFETGLKVRKSILGEAHVSRSLEGATAFSQPFQDYITRNVWGDVWGRPTMQPAIRRLMTLTMLIALNRPDEYKLHVRAALDAGLTVADLREAILLSLVYCGVPAANCAIKWTEEVFAAQGIDVEAPAQQTLTFAPD